MIYTSEQLHTWLDAFVEHYCEALLWANTYVYTGDPEAEPVSVEPAWWISPSSTWRSDAFDTDSRGKIREDCADFVVANWRDLRNLTPEQSGHDFLLTRSGHGAGFWDRGLGAVGDRLTAACRPYGDTSAWCHADDDPTSDNLAHVD